MKTAITVLQEMMVKLGDVPEYECISQTGPQHSSMFEYRCSARGAVVTATARSKKEAKQEAASAMLRALDARGLAVPAPYRTKLPAQTSPPPLSSSRAVGLCGETVGGTAAHSFVALLKDLCDEYRMPACEYELVSDTGPPHARLFTVRARFAAHERHATAGTKKAAKQSAAEQLYKYLRENLARLTKDFVEEEAMVRAHEKAMGRYVEAREGTWRPDLGQRVADYHLGLLTHIDIEKRQMALETLAAAGEASAPDTLLATAAALGLRVEMHELPASGGGLFVAELAPTAPPVALAGTTPAAAACAALQYLRLALQQPEPQS